MKELKRIIDVYENVDFTQRKAALATIVKLYGSSYRRPGARMLITDDGRWEGAISGGCLEGDALRKARQVISSSKPMVVTYDTMNDDANNLGVGLGCNGIIDVLIEPISPNHFSNPIRFFKAFTENADKGTAVLATVFSAEGNTGLHVGDRLMLQQDGTLVWNREEQSLPVFLTEDLKSIARSGHSQTKIYDLPQGKAEVFIEILHPGIHLVVFGGGYDAIPVVRLAKEMGWHITVTDDCIAHLTPLRFPAAHQIVHAARESVLAHIPIHSFTAAVLMSHNYKYDMAVLEQLFTTNIPYIGMLGPKKRSEKMFEQFTQEGKIFNSEMLSRLHSPVGMDIGAETPDEIALSIITEIQAVFSGKTGGFLKQKPGFIHERDTHQAANLMNKTYIG